MGLISTLVSFSSMLMIFIVFFFTTIPSTSFAIVFMPIQRPLLCITITIAIINLIREFKTIPSFEV